MEKRVVAAFVRSHAGWSVDEVLLNDARREDFLRACRQKDIRAAESPATVGGSGPSGSGSGKPSHDEPEATNANHATNANQATDAQAELNSHADEYCAVLLHVRKAGGRLPRTSRRAVAKPDGNPAEIEVIAEIAARRLEDQLNCHTDAMLTCSVARNYFDKVVGQMVPVDTTYEFRKAAVRLRKTRRLEPELLARVTDWRRTIVEFSVEQLRAQPELAPEDPGVYVFRDLGGYLYIGQASDLSKRIKEHVHQSDRKDLAAYLSENPQAAITVELHVFGEGSPGRELRVRRAYESALIRTRKPRLNLAP